MNTFSMASGAALVDAAWLDAHRSEVCLVEITRDAGEEMRGRHLPGAVSANWKQLLWDPLMREFPAPADFAARLGRLGISNATKIVFYGEPVQYGTYAWWVFRYCGHRESYLLDGGHRRWEAEGRPSTDAIATPQPAHYVAGERVPAMRIGRDEVRAAIGDPDTVILDVRSPEEYRGDAVGPPGSDHGAERYGRIPGARHRHYADLLTADERFKPRDELRALFEASGVRREQNVILYCRLSHRASMAYFALTEILGYPRARVYDGSWTEWGSLVGFPIER